MKLGIRLKDSVEEVESCNFSLTNLQPHFFDPCRNLENRELPKNNLGGNVLDI